MKSSQSKTHKNYLTYILSLVIIMCVLASYFLIPAVKDFFDNAWQVLISDDEQRIKQWVDGFGWFGPMIIVLAMVIQMFLLIIPTILLMIVAILAYGPFWGSVIILIAIFSSSSVGYFIGTKFGKKLIIKLMGQKSEESVEAFIDHYGFWAVIITRINPFLSNDAISFVTGMLNMGYWRFLGATFIGILPLTILIAIFGDTTDTLKTGLFWGSLAILLGAILYFWLKKRNKTSKDPS